MATILNDMTAVFNSILGWTGNVFDMIAQQPLALLFICGSFALIAVGVVKRLLSL